MKNQALLSSKDAIFVWRFRIKYLTSAVLKS